MAKNGLSTKSNELQKEVRAMERRSSALMKKLKKGGLTDDEDDELQQLFKDIHGKAAEAIEAILSDARKS